MPRSVVFIYFFESAQSIFIAIEIEFISTCKYEIIFCCLLRILTSFIEVTFDFIKNYFENIKRKFCYNYVIIALFTNYKFMLFIKYQSVKIVLGIYYL
jgi:hypothetical protein